jgi:hypothetical protein
VAEEHAAHLRGLVLQREIEVSRWRPRAAGNLAADPEQPQVTLEQETRRGDEARDRHDGRGRTRRRCRRVFDLGRYGRRKRSGVEEIAFWRAVIVHLDAFRDTLG